MKPAPPRFQDNIVTGEKKKQIAELAKQNNKSNNKTMQLYFSSTFQTQEGIQYVRHIQIKKRWNDMSFFLKKRNLINEYSEINSWEK